MNVTINTEIDEQIKKCTELIAKYEQLEEHSKKLHFITIKDLAEMKRLFYKNSTSNFSIIRFSIRKFW